MEIIMAILCSSVCSTIFTHIFYGRKLKKELKTVRNSQISEDIAVSLQNIRNMVLLLDYQEIYNYENEIIKENQEFNFFENNVVYLSVFNDNSSFNKFLKKLSICREKDEKNLPYKLKIQLSFLQKYFLQLKLFINDHGGEKELRFWGTIFSVDLINWKEVTNKIIIYEINKSRYRLKYDSQQKRKRLRKKYLENQYQKTILYNLMSGTYNTNPKLKKWSATIQSLLEKKT